VAEAKQIGALGSAMHAAVAAGVDAGGYAHISDASAKMARLREKSYQPDPAATPIYDRLYSEYKILHDYFGTGPNDVMKRLKALKVETRAS